VTVLRRGARKPGEPIYLRRHLLALILAVSLPVVLLQLYKIYVGPVSFDAQMGFGIVVSILAGLILYYTYRSSAQNQP
jgi:multisubunit Na+/H+ antiporter MnhF subunit